MRCVRIFWVLVTYQGCLTLSLLLWKQRNNWDKCWEYLNKFHNVCWFECFAFYHGPPHADWCVREKKNTMQLKTAVSRLWNAKWPADSNHWPERKKRANKQIANRRSAGANQIKNTFRENSFQRTAARLAKTSQCGRPYRKSMPIADTKKSPKNTNLSPHRPTSWCWTYIVSAYRRRHRQFVVHKSIYLWAINHTAAK